jgi:hypothetical protein
MFASDGVAASLDSVAHVIQVALTPIFLLSGIAALLNVFSTRLGRVSDRVDQLAQQAIGADPHEARRIAALLAFQRRRSQILDVAVVLGALAGGATCGATLTLFACATGPGRRCCSCCSGWPCWRRWVRSWPSSARCC